MTLRWIMFGLGLLASWPVAATELTIATYNIENYVAANRMIPAGYRKNYPKPEVAKAALREVIQAVNADVLVMQEMGPKPYLDELQRDLAAQGLFYPHAVLLDAADADRHVAVLSRHAFSKVRQHTRLRFRYLDGEETVKRGLLEIGLQTPRGELTLWALHLKSRYTDNNADPDSAQRRAKEAMAIREFILDHLQDMGQGGYVILGDFNAGRSSAPLRYLRRRGKLTFAKLLPATDAHGEHWTYHYRRDDTYSRVDHILVSPDLMQIVKDGEARIHGGTSVRAASDHRPVKVTLLYGDNIPPQHAAQASQVSAATSPANKD
ncbi:MAG: endonuclease/exonuclease/phosphatase family protein [Cephaloticoccus sp.]|nr:endonuclease/exonuclease/phosphatase family protein [Cephaloticoccus sp.]MCF7760528.1 endonuclease/exonuclease/phosphatase family protein [Cephaloticoccus sp.]